MDLEKKTVIISSALDPAGRNIRKYLLERYFSAEIGRFEGKIVFGYKEFALVELDEELIYLKGLESRIKAKSFIFASKHSSKANIHSLTVHTSGNWGKADFGGKEEQICVSEPIGMKNCLLYMKEHQFGDFEVSLEVTHHGPSDLKTPSFWAEIGSSKQSWNNPKAGEVVAEAILTANSRDWSQIAVGFGGVHYAPAFSRVVLESDYAVGHIMPKHGNFTTEMINKAILKTPKSKYIILDWKGLSKTQKAAIEIANQSHNFEILRSYKL